MNPNSTTSAKSLWRVSITTTPAAEDAVTELLHRALGQPASSYFDAKTGVNTVTAYLSGKRPWSDRLRESISVGLQQIRDCGLNVGPGRILAVKVRRENWAESWKRHFQPIEIRFKNRRNAPGESPASRDQSGTRITRPSEAMGKSLLIKPSWNKRKPRKGQAMIVLDPGLSFGTGHHPTTAFCLNEIVQFQTGRDNGPGYPDATPRCPCRKPPSLLDLGTGTGILAIAAVKLGYSPVLAMDFDPEAVRVARANARINRVEQQLKIRRSDVAKLPGRPRRQYDLVCANLISNLLIDERRRIVAQLNRTGTLVLAGILKPEFKEVQKAYETLGLRLISHRDEKEWCSGSFRFDL
ncbi:MAG TPA: 50S ribosomal protein L11 methyltransferase [Verrucomicrobiae bacterium]|nr:50S ribosomal protein L11 methyltransferase [Verrucomicrobiae bacterium]